MKEIARFWTPSPTKQHNAWFAIDTRPHPSPNTRMWGCFQDPNYGGFGPLFSAKTMVFQIFLRKTQETKIHLLRGFGDPSPPQLKFGGRISPKCWRIKLDKNLGDNGGRIKIAILFWIFTPYTRILSVIQPRSKWACHSVMEVRCIWYRVQLCQIIDSGQ